MSPSRRRFLTASGFHADGRCAQHPRAGRSVLIVEEGALKSSMHGVSARRATALAKTLKGAA